MPDQINYQPIGYFNVVPNYCVKTALVTTYFANNVNNGILFGTLQSCNLALLLIEFDKEKFTHIVYCNVKNNNKFFNMYKV